MDHICGEVGMNPGDGEINFFFAWRVSVGQVEYYISSFGMLFTLKYDQAVNQVFSAIILESPSELIPPRITKQINK